jgi:hypothetical protein
MCKSVADVGVGVIAPAGTFEDLCTMKAWHPMLPPSVVVCMDTSRKKQAATTASDRNDAFVFVV